VVGSDTNQSAVCAMEGKYEPALLHSRRARPQI
jgi:hypothetical protein